MFFLKIKLFVLDVKAICRGHKFSVAVVSLHFAFVRLSLHRSAGVFLQVSVYLCDAWYVHAHAFRRFCCWQVARGSGSPPCSRALFRPPTRPAWVCASLVLGEFPGVLCCIAATLPSIPNLPRRSFIHQLRSRNDCWGKSGRTDFTRYYCTGANLCSKNDVFLNKPLVPGSFAAWGRTSSPKNYFF